MSIIRFSIALIVVVIGGILMEANQRGLFLGIIGVTIYYHEYYKNLS